MAYAETPARTRDPQHARVLVDRDGAAILTGWGMSPDDAVAAAHAVFGDDVLHAPMSSEVAGSERDRRPPPVDPTVPQPPHTEGFAYGNSYPDYLVLSCAHASPDGGESFLVDGEAVVDHLAGRPGGRDLVRRLQTVAVDQSEPGTRREITPVIGRTVAGRLMLRRFPHQRVADDSTEGARDAAMLDAWQSAITTAAAAAPRFNLRPGDVAVIDNYRMLRGQEAYADLDRLMWRVWVCTIASWGVPPGRLPADSRYATAD